MEMLESILVLFVNLAMLLFEYVGVIIITISGIQGIVNYVKKAPDTRMILAKGLAMGLEFKMGSEILRTVIVNNFDEILMVAGIIGLRAFLTLLIHWEIKNEEKEEKVHEASGSRGAAAMVAAAVNKLQGNSEAVPPVNKLQGNSEAVPPVSKLQGNGEAVLSVNEKKETGCDE